MPKYFEKLVKPQKKSKFHLKLGIEFLFKTKSRMQKYMTDSLKTNVFFIGLHLTVNEVCL